MRRMVGHWEGRREPLGLGQEVGLGLGLGLGL